MYTYRRCVRSLSLSMEFSSECSSVWLVWNALCNASNIETKSFLLLLLLLRLLLLLVSQFQMMLFLWAHTHYLLCTAPVYNCTGPTTIYIYMYVCSFSYGNWKGFSSLSSMQLNEWWLLLMTCRHSRLFTFHYSALMDWYVVFHCWLTGSLTRLHCIHWMLLMRLKHSHSNYRA